MGVTIASLEAQVNERWGSKQTDWTIGKCPEGWFFYCGTRTDPWGKSQWGHKGYAPTLTAVLHAMLAVEEPARERDDGPAENPDEERA